MAIKKIILGDKNPDLISAWEKEFAGVENVVVRGGNLLLVQADALVSPANSFGFMDGGIDWSISELFEWKIQPLVQDIIRKKHMGELVVGHAEIVGTNREKYPYLVCAPTMRVPQNVAESINALLAMRALLIAIERFNELSDKPIESVAIPGLCTGIGRMPYSRCARQMRVAFDQVYRNISNNYNCLDQAIELEKELKNYA